MIKLSKKLDLFFCCSKNVLIISYMYYKKLKLTWKISVVNQ